MRYIISFLLTSIALPGWAEVPTVVTDMPPVHALVSAVMGRLGQPDLLLDRGASAHHFSLRPSQARAVANADLVVFLGPQMTPWIEGALQNRQGQTLGLLASPGSHLQAFGAATADHDHENHHDHDHDDHDDSLADQDHAAPSPSQNHGHSNDPSHGHSHSHEGLDPHAWLDPENGKLWLQVIARELSKLDPEHAASYSSNAEAATLAIDAAAQETSRLLAPVKGQPFLVSHDAYGYFIGHFGLNMAGAVALGDAASPGAKRLTALQDRISQGEIRCIFPEAGQDPALVTMLAEAKGLRLGQPLDPEGVQLTPGPALYGQILTDTAAKIAACLQE